MDWRAALIDTAWDLAGIVAIVAPLFVAVAYLTLWERKLIGWMQIRIGPNRVTFFGIRWLGGLAQPIADGVKLLFKEVILPTNASGGLFFLGPVLMLMPALAAWACGSRRCTKVSTWAGTYDSTRALVRSGSESTC